MDQQVNIDLIEQYLNNELSETEKLEFENKVGQDEALAAELDRRQTAHRMIDFMIKENLRSQLKSLEKEDTKIISIAPRKRRMYTLAIAASIIILIGAFFMLLPGEGSLTNQQIALNFYELPTSTLRGSDNASLPEQVAAGLNALQSANYAEAIGAFEQITPSNDYYVLSRYYLGHAQFLAKDYAGAEASFALVSGSNDIRYVEEAEWYQLLSCLGLDRSCDSVSDHIANNPTHEFHEKAIEIKEAQSR